MIKCIFIAFIYIYYNYIAGNKYKLISLASFILTTLALTVNGGISEVFHQCCIGF